MASAALLLQGIQSSTDLIVYKPKLSIDNLTFKLFYQWTVTQLICFSILITCNQIFGDPIVCDLPGEGVNTNVLHSFCLMYSTFDIPSYFAGPCARKQRQESVYNTYYQWVAIFLIVQAIIFYIPRIIWLMLEGGLMNYLGKGTTGELVENVDEKIESLMSIFKDNLENKYNRYTFLFFLCEFLNLLVVFSQFFITDVFLQNQFISYGPDVFSFYQTSQEQLLLSENINPMCEAFPRVVSCTYWKFGGGGRQIKYKALCILSLNILIDKIYVWLWFWYIFVGILCTLKLIFRIFQISSSRIRFFLLRFKLYRFFDDDEDLASIKGYLNRCKIGDWFVLYQMSKNLNGRFFFNFLLKLSKGGKDHEL